MTYKVLVTCKQMQESLDELLAENPMPDFSFTTPELTKQGFTSSEIAELIKGHDAAIVGDDVVDEAVLSVPGLGFVCKWGAGVDGIDFIAAKHYGVPVENTPGLFGDDVADLAFAYLVSLTRELYKIDRNVREGAWPRIRGVSLEGLEVLVYGFGNIGQEISKRLVSSKCNVRAYDIRRDFASKAMQLGVSPVASLEEGARGSRAIIVACPLNKNTINSVNSSILELMSPQGYLVNVSRGRVVVEGDLIKSIKNKSIRASALDVFELEPLPMDSELRTLDNIVFGSHNASNAESSVQKASRRALQLLQCNIGL